jgi:hypothetical protein
VGRPSQVYPEVLAVERECLNCGEPFTPAREGWQALYCQVACWRANNGGPIVHQVFTAGGSRPPLPACAPEPPPAYLPLAVVGSERCPVCGTDHDVYGYPEAR